MSIRINEIDIESLRGIPSLKLKFNNQSMVLFGENGTGKSSIVDAFEFFFTGKISHLDGTQGISFKKHGHHTLSNIEDISVKVEFHPTKTTLSRTFDSLFEVPDELKDYFEITQKGTFILRRSHLLEFILSKPADRYRAVGNIIGIGPLDDIELDMKRVRDNIDGKIDSKKEYLNKLIKEVSEIIGKDVETSEDVLKSLNETLSDADLPLLVSLDKVNEHAEEMMKKVESTDSLDKIRILNDILKKIDEFSFIDSLDEDIKTLASQIEQFIDKDSQNNLKTMELLKNGNNVLKTWEEDNCPLCKQKIDKDELIGEIGSRLNSLKVLSDEASEIRKNASKINENIKIALNNLKEINSLLQHFPEFKDDQEKLTKNIGFFDEFIDLNPNLEHKLDKNNFSDNRNLTTGLIEKITSDSEVLLEKIGLSDDKKRVLEIVRLIENAQKSLKSISNVKNDIKSLEKQLFNSNLIYSTFSDVKKQKIQNIYDSIQNDIESFYATIHPDEPHKNIKIIVSPGKRASTKLIMESFGRSKEDPRALTSEGHLDSLGLCIFLAFAKKFNDNCSLLILDDVVTTIDSKHRMNICKLLINELSEKQILITTHDAIWYKQIMNYLNINNLRNSFENYEIVSWDVESGPKLIPYKYRLERIKAKLDDGDKRGAANEGRQYLESTLELICKITQANVPYKEYFERYSAGELLPSAKNRLINISKDEAYKNEAEKAFKNLEETNIYGNLLSHDNPYADSITMDEVSDFCQKVDELHKLLVCTTCNKYIKYSREFKILRCSKVNCEDPYEIRTN